MGFFFFYYERVDSRFVGVVFSGEDGFIGVGEMKSEGRFVW